MDSFISYLLSSFHKTTFQLTYSPLQVLTGLIMKSLILVIAVGVAIASAKPQLQGSVATNPLGGNDVNLRAGQRFGTDAANFGGGVFATGNTLKGPVTTGGFLDANKNGHGIGLQHSNTPGFGKTFSQNAHVNLLQNNNHKLDANAFHSRTNMENGFKFDRVGGGLDYSHAAGHAASLSASRIPQVGMNSVDLMGKANLWRSPDRQTSFDVTGTASRNFGGGMPARNNFGAGVGMTHWFG